MGVEWESYKLAKSANIPLCFSPQQSVLRNSVCLLLEVCANECHLCLLSNQILPARHRSPAVYTVI